MALRDLAIRYETLRHEPTGAFTTNRNGRRVEVTEAKVYLVTDLGELAQDKWRRLVLLAVTEEDKEELLWEIEMHVRSHCAWLKTEQEIKDYALECLASESYKAWEGFGEK